MRRLSVMFAVGAALVVPVVALAGTGPSTDGSLVIQHGAAPLTPLTPVAVITITGSVIGTVAHGRVVIDGGPNVDPSKAPQVTQNAQCITRDGETALRCKGDNFSFRAVGGKYVLLVYGTDISLVAVGTGTVRLAGVPDTPHGDGRYSLNGADFTSLPGTQTDKLPIASSSNG
jgi:hypothetical protein